MRTFGIVCLLGYDVYEYFNDDYAYSPFRLISRRCPRFDGAYHYCVFAHRLCMYSL